MQLRVDVVTRAVSTWAGVSVSRLTFPRIQSAPAELQFVKRGQIIELPAGTPIDLVLVAASDSALLASATSWSQVGSGSSTYYLATLNLNTIPLEGNDDDIVGLFEADPAPRSIACEFAIRWTPPGQSIITTAENGGAIPATIFNVPVVGPVADPQPAAPQYPAAVAVAASIQLSAEVAGNLANEVSRAIAAEEALDAAKADVSETTEALAEKAAKTLVNVVPATGRAALGLGELAVKDKAGLADFDDDALAQIGDQSLEIEGNWDPANEAWPVDTTGDMSSYVADMSAWRIKTTHTWGGVTYQATGKIVWNGGTAGTAADFDLIGAAPFDVPDGALDAVKFTPATQQRLLINASAGDKVPWDLWLGEDPLGQVAVAASVARNLLQFNGKNVAEQFAVEDREYDNADEGSVWLEDPRGFMVRIDRAEVDPPAPADIIDFSTLRAPNGTADDFVRYGDVWDGLVGRSLPPVAFTPDNNYAQIPVFFSSASYWPDEKRGTTTVTRQPSACRSKGNTVFAHAEGRIGGTGDDRPNTTLLSRSDDRGYTWSPQVEFIKAFFGSDQGLVRDIFGAYDARTDRHWIVFNIGPAEPIADMFDQHEPYAVYFDWASEEWRGAAGTELTLPIDPSDAISLAYMGAAIRFGMGPAWVKRLGDNAGDVFFPFRYHQNESEMDWTNMDWGLAKIDPDWVEGTAEPFLVTLRCPPLTANQPGTGTPYHIEGDEDNITELPDGNLIVFVRPRDPANIYEGVLIFSGDGETLVDYYFDPALVGQRMCRSAITISGLGDGQPFRLYHFANRSLDNDGSDVRNGLECRCAYSISGGRPVWTTSTGRIFPYAEITTQDILGNAIDETTYTQNNNATCAYDASGPEGPEVGLILDKRLRTPSGWTIYASTPTIHVRPSNLTKLLGED